MNNIKEWIVVVVYFDDENSLNYYAVFPDFHVEVSAVNLDDMQIQHAKHFLKAEVGS